MRARVAWGLSVLASGLFAAQAALAGLILGAPVDVIGNIPVASFTSLGYGTNAYKDWGNEPYVAVNPLNTNQIVVSSFSFGTSSTSVGANFFYSTDAGASWTSQFTVPAPAAGVGIPNDWNFAYDSTGTLHAAVLGGCNATCNIFQGSTTDPTQLASWTWTGGGTRINSAASVNKADQPWIALQGGKVFVGYDDFHSLTGERVAVSNNNGTTFTVDNAINNGAQTNFVNPGTRIATDGAGTVYSIFGVGDSGPSPGVHNVSYFLNRSSDGGVTWDFNASSAIGGILIGSGVSAQLDNSGTQASNRWFAGVNDLRGNITAIASDKTGAHIYTVIGKRDGSGTDRLFLVEFHPSGGNLVASAAVVISPAGERAALPSITVLDNGTVVIMYDSFGADQKVHVHVATSHDFGATIDSDVEEYSFTPLSLLAATGSSGSNREFGDYDFIMSVGDTFYGAFAGLGDVNGGGINTTALIDPFFFSGTDVGVPEPGSLALLLSALTGLAWRRRRPAVTARA
jgi:hypothetical protein